MILKFCTEHGSDTAVLCAKFQYFVTTDMIIIGVCNKDMFCLFTKKHEASGDIYRRYKTHPSLQENQGYNQCSIHMNSAKVFSQDSWCKTRRTLET